MRSDVSDRNEICDQIDDLITSVESSKAADDWVPADCKARFDALYETIDAFAGAIDDRMQALATRVEGSFDGTAERDALTTTSPDRG